MDTYSARELRATAGVSPEVLDYWTRTALVVPDGPGTYSARSMSLAIVLAAAARAGAPGPALARLTARLDGPVGKWPEHLWVTPNGDVHDEDDAPTSIVVHVRLCLASAGRMLAHALSAA